MMKKLCALSVSFMFVACATSFLHGFVIEVMGDTDLITGSIVGQGKEQKFEVSGVKFLPGWYNDYSVGEGTFEIRLHAYGMPDFKQVIKPADLAQWGITLGNLNEPYKVGLVLSVENKHFVTSFRKLTSDEAAVFQQQKRKEEQRLLEEKANRPRKLAARRVELEREIKDLEARITEKQRELEAIRKELGQ